MFLLAVKTLLLHSAQLASPCRLLLESDFEGAIIVKDLGVAICNHDLAYDLVYESGTIEPHGCPIKSS